jgi:hypothetical protein
MFLGPENRVVPRPCPILFRLLAAILPGTCKFSVCSGCHRLVRAVVGRVFRELGFMSTTTWQSIGERKAQMADDREIAAELETLSAETKRALLTKIRARAGDPASPSDIAYLAHAYALVEGAKIGVLPGAPKPKG